MSKPSQRVLITLPHPLLHLVSLGLVSFIFTLFSLELSQFGTQLAPLWFPTSIMMVAFYRHAGRMWPGIALACSLGNIAASVLLFSTSSLNMTWTAINIIEAVVGAMLLRKLLPWYNPLQNLADWLRLAFGSAIVPPLLGGVLVVLLTPGDDPLRAFLIWVLSESIGALALVPLGLLFKPHYLLRHRNPRLLFENAADVSDHIDIKLAFDAVSAVAFYFHYCAADVERRAPATNGSLFDLPHDSDDGFVNDGCRPHSACHAASVPDEPYAVAAIFADSASRQHHDHGDVRLPHGT